MRGSRFAVPLVVLSLVAASCADSGASGPPSPGPGADRIAHLGVPAIVDATVLKIDEVPATEAFAGFPRVTFRVDRVRWQSRWDPETVNERFPAAAIEAGERVEAIDPSERGAIGQLEPGSTYVLFLFYSYGSQTDPFWGVELAVHPDGTLLPAYDLDGARKVLDALLLPGETDVVEALVDYNIASLRELYGARPPGSSPRTAAVEELYRRAERDWAAPTDPPESPEAVWRATPPRQRYLPQDPIDAPVWLDQALGDTLVPYEVLVLHDDVLGDVETISLFVEDAGLLGRHVVDRAAGATAISGMAPAGRPLELVGWSTGRDALDAAPDRTLATFSGLAPVGPRSDEITAIVDLRGDRPTIRPLSREAFDGEILRLRATLSREEPDPRDPSPGG